ncbi:protocadherin Fat 4-like [Littorina saxatilis]|uniref:protocadherin Fat 4-like n=1 Tax=Littorina saxatilis TaxID=31220 RepID=UPI0038B50E2B
MVSGNTDNNIEYFKVYPDTGQLILTENADLDSIPNDRFVLTLAATDQGSPTRTGEVTITVIIDKDPGQLLCGQNPFVFTTSENSNVNTVVGSVTAAPSASGEHHLPLTQRLLFCTFQSISYIVVGSPPGDSFFRMNSSGVIIVSADLRTDPVKLQNYQVLVEATRSAVAVQSVTCTVSITVTRNENAPVFQFPLGLNSYTVTINDTAPLGEVIQTVSATDADRDTIAYSLTGSIPATSAFFLHPARGDIVLIQSLLGTASDSYVLTVRASDQRSPDAGEAFANVTVIVLRDTFGPEFSQDVYSAPSVREDAGTGSTVISVQATDRDIKGQLVFEVVGNSTAPAFFTLGPARPTQPNTAVADVIVRDAGYLRRDQSTSYLLTLIVYDSAYPYTYDTAQVNITMARNLNAPVLNSTSYSVTIPESLATGTTFFTAISATDADGVRFLLFSIHDAEEWKIKDPVQFNTMSSVRGDYYSIDPFTGYVSLARSLLNTTHNADLLNLQVTDMRDGNERTDSADLTVNIIRSPRFTNLPEQTTVERSAAVNTVVYTVSATDGNSVGEINYKLEGNYPALSYFVVDRVSGAVTMNTTSLLADSLLLESYQLEFLAYNTVYPTNQATSTLTIVIDRNPNAPTCDPAGVAITVDPQTLPGAVVATVTATDPESNSLRYSFAQADQETRDQFFIAADTGNIILRKAIGNLPPNKVFNFTVEASDQGQPRAKNCTTRVQFTLGSDEPPVFYSNNSPTTTYTWNINETAFQNGARFTSVSARDTDLQGQLIFKAIGDLRAPYFFSVDNITAAVTVRNDVRDSDLETSYKLLITAYDSLRPTTLATSTVVVTVDRNPSAPAVQNINVTIEELTPVSTIIANVTASDSDGDTLEYSLEGTAVSVAGLEYFWINPTTGSVRVMKPITQDTTDNERYEMTVIVRDRATPQKSAQASVIVHVLRDDFPPVFMNTPYTTDISENTLAISSIFTVSADDPDLREQLVYEKIGDDEAVYFFDVDRLNGTIYLVNGLLTDNKTSYTLRVQAYDTAYPEQKTSVTVQIQVRRNEYSPVFAPSPITVTIEETVQIGSVITFVNATDQDARVICFL